MTAHFLALIKLSLNVRAWDDRREGERERKREREREGEREMHRREEEEIRSLKNEEFCCCALPLVALHSSPA